MRKNKGFSLIELMIAVAIIGILATLAYPSYTDYVAKSARADGLAALLKVANLQEQFYLDNKEYATDMNLLGLGADPYITDNGMYSIYSKGSKTFTVVATAQGVQASRDSDCLTIKITDIGKKTPRNCWQ